MTDATDPVDIAIGARIRTRREELRITQAQLAAGAGVTFQQIQKYERGVNRVSAARLLQIAAVLKSTGAASASSSPSAVSSSPNRAAPGVSELLNAFRGIHSAEKRDALLLVAKSLQD